MPKLLDSGSLSVWSTGDGEFIVFLSGFPVYLYLGHRNPHTHTQAAMGNELLKVSEGN